MMIRRILLLLCLAVLGFPAVASADDNLSYNDPSVHYTAPAGWTRVDVPEGRDAPAAVFTKSYGRYDDRVITLRIQDYSGSLSGLATTHESELRTQNQDLFVERKQPVTLSNGMPGWQLRYSYGIGTGQSVRAIDYVFYDGRRSVVATYAGRVGAFDDKEAALALSALTVVLYPNDR